MRKTTATREALLHGFDNSTLGILQLLTEQVIKVCFDNKSSKKLSPYATFENGLNRYPGFGWKVFEALCVVYFGAHATTIYSTTGDSRFDGNAYEVDTKDGTGVDVLAIDNTGVQAIQVKHSSNPNGRGGFSKSALLTFFSTLERIQTLGKTVSGVLFTNRRIYSGSLNADLKEKHIRVVSTLELESHFQEVAKWRSLLAAVQGVPRLRACSTLTLRGVRVSPVKMPISHSYLILKGLVQGKPDKLVPLLVSSSLGIKIHHSNAATSASCALEKHKHGNTYFQHTLLSTNFLSRDNKSRESSTYRFENHANEVRLNQKYLKYTKQISLASDKVFVDLYQANSWINLRQTAEAAKTPATLATTRKMLNKPTRTLAESSGKELDNRKIARRSHKHRKRVQENVKGGKSAGEKQSTRHTERQKERASERAREERVRGPHTNAHRHTKRKHAHTHTQTLTQERERERERARAARLLRVAVVR